MQEELRPYFALPKVMDGLFSLAKRLFGIDIEAADGLAPVISIYICHVVCLLTDMTIDFNSCPVYSCLICNRFGTMMSDSTVSKTL